MKKLEVKLIGEDGNVFNLVSIVRKALERNGQEEEAEEVVDRVFNSGSYEEALNIMGEYVDIV